jgi:GNAT superfamily N-acetyltransferase
MSAEIATLTPAAAGDADLVAAIAALVNKVYGESEQGLWTDGAARTTHAEIVRLIEAAELVAAFLDGELVGIVRHQQLDELTGEFGMLAAEPAVRGRGIGGDLIRYAEDASRARGHRYMQLELLVPRDWELASKEFLARWYDRLGYRLERVGAIEEAYPHLAPLLATPADFRIYRKRL